MERMNVTLTTGGACSGNPGPGGYASILRFGNNFKTVCGYDPHTTNNRMELAAVIEAVKVLKKPCNILIRTNSQFICNGIANAKERSQNGWKTRTGARCANYDMWQVLNDLGRAGHHHFRYESISRSDDDNKECSKLAKEQIKENA